MLTDTVTLTQKTCAALFWPTDLWPTPAGNRRFLSRQISPTAGPWRERCSQYPSFCPQGTSLLLASFSFWTWSAWVQIDRILDEIPDLRPWDVNNSVTLDVSLPRRATANAGECNTKISSQLWSLPFLVMKCLMYVNRWVATHLQEDLAPLVKNTIG